MSTIRKIAGSKYTFWLYNSGFWHENIPFVVLTHIETLVCLSKKTEKHINIDVEFGEEEGELSLKKLQEELKRPRSHPTTEMVEAIKDALKYFAII